MIAEALYNNATTVAQVEGPSGRPCFSGLQAERVSNAFDYDPSTDQVVCAQGQRSIGKVRIGNGDLYYFFLTDCGVCPLRDGCLTRGEREGTALPRRRVFLSDVRKQKRLEGVVSWDESVETRPPGLRTGSRPNPEGAARPFRPSRPGQAPPSQPLSQQPPVPRLDRLH